MLFKKIICIFLLVMLAGRTAIAENSKAEFMVLKTGEIAKFTGYLFTPEAIAQIYSICNEDVQLARVECNADIVSINLELQKEKELRNIEVAVKNKLISDITALKDKAITDRDKLILDIEEERNRNKIYIAGSFIVGILLTGSIFYIANNVGR